jgi:L,D-transpeptidase ErfK/SrfK
MLLPHPASFFGQPVVGGITANDWTVSVATLNDAKTAQKLTAIVNHQGPVIPTRTFQEGSLFRVVSGPFATEQEANGALKRIHNEFELDGRVNPPQSYSGYGFTPQNFSNQPSLYNYRREPNFFEKLFNSISNPF